MQSPGEEARSRARFHAHQDLPQSGSKPVERARSFCSIPQSLELEAGPTADRSWLRTIYPYSLDVPAKQVVANLKNKLHSTSSSKMKLLGWVLR
jgi:hypothetical protein